MSLKEDRNLAYKKYCRLLETEEFLEDDPKAMKEAEEIKKEIKKIDFELMSPKQQFHKLVNDAAEEEDKKAGLE